MWKIVALSVLFAVISMCSSGDYKELGIVYATDFTLVDDQYNDVCSMNKDGTKKCNASPGQKMDFWATFVFEGCDCNDFYITLMWVDLCKNASTRSYTCPDPCYDNNLVIHGDCRHEVIHPGTYTLQPFRFSIPSDKGAHELALYYDADFGSGGKIRNCYLGTMWVDCY